MSGQADQELRRRAERVIPGGMYGHQSVRPLPSNYPQFFSRAAGAYLWDVDGKRYLDYLGGFGPNLFGYGEPSVQAAFLAQLERGDAMTGPSTAMVDLAEAFVGIVRHASWAMFCKNGTDANSMAMMIARAATGKRKILIARGAYHGAAPWCTPVLSGVLPEDRAHQIPYEYNDAASLDAAVAEAGDDLAAIFATPFKHDTYRAQEPLDRAFARRARERCDATGALLVVDDVRGGFRIARDCSWSLAGVEPDLSSWGKVIANGHPLSALLGNERARTAASSIFTTGSYWFSAAAMAASIATLKLVRETEYLERTIELGTQLREGLAEAARRHDVDFRQSGPVQMPLFLFGEDAELTRGHAFSSAMLDRGFYLHPWHNMFICAAMTEADIEATVDAADASFAAMKAHA